MNVQTNNLHVHIHSHRPNIVYAPHTYTHSFTKWKDPFWLALDSAIAEATIMHAAVFVTEFGAPSVEKKLLEMLDQQDMHGVGSTFWPWKERGGWGMFNHSGADPALGEGPMKPLHRQALCRILPIATVGLVQQFSYNWTTAAFTLHAVAPPAISQHATSILARTTIVFVPAHVPPAPCEVTGAAQFWRSVVAPDGSRQLLINVTTAGGEYSVSIPGNATWPDV